MTLLAFGAIFLSFSGNRGIRESAEGVRKKGSERRGTETDPVFTKELAAGDGGVEVGDGIHGLLGEGFVEVENL